MIYIAKNSHSLAEEIMQSLRNHHNYSVDSQVRYIWFFPLYLHIYACFTSSASPISINITGFSFRFHYLIQESGFDLTNLSLKILTSIDHPFFCFFIRLPQALIVHSSVSVIWTCNWWQEKKKKFVLGKYDWVKFAVYSRQDKDKSSI